MADYVFQKIAKRGEKLGYMHPRDSSAAVKWFQGTAQATRPNPKAFVSKSSEERRKTAVSSGRMYAFFYDPKTKETLPYYDRFPLIFAVGRAKGGFYGLNLHYLPPELRAKLMNALFELRSTKSLTENTKIKMSYNILSAASKYKYFKPCFKHYLTKHVRSSFILINPSEWDMAMMLPMQRFAKASTKQVWRDSRNAI